MLMDRQADKNEQMNRQNYSNFRKEPSYDSDLSPSQV